MRCIIGGNNPQIRSIFWRNVIARIFPIYTKYSFLHRHASPCRACEHHCAPFKRNQSGQLPYPSTLTVAPNWCSLISWHATTSKCCPHSRPWPRYVNAFNWWSTTLMGNLVAFSIASPFLTKLRAPHFNLGKERIICSTYSSVNIFFITVMRGAKPRFSVF